MNEPVYSSVFKAELKDHVKIKKALGFSYDSQAAAFLRIDAFFNNSNLAEKMISK